jgi:LmbE family N-acetylglucosaminyl deacetylase
MRSLFFTFFILLAFCAGSLAQVRPANDQGALGLGLLLRRLNTTASVMMIGAHPDDEDSALLAYLARGENARTAYLSLTRGDGGQNIIGPELFESLGVIRTEELLQARRLDGAEQYFTRAFDYGFSKTLAEARAKWPQDLVLCDAVRAIRIFKPQVVIARFTGTPADGHGQHQFSGYLAPIAVKAAADPQQCTMDGPPWQIKKFYVEQSFSSSAPAALRVDTGKFDPLFGRSYFEIAMEGRSQHRSQGEGRLELHGPIFSGLNLAESTVPKLEKETSIFDGIDTTLKKIVPEVSERTERALKEYNPNEPQKLLPLLEEAYISIAQKRSELFGRLEIDDMPTQPAKPQPVDQAAYEAMAVLEPKQDQLAEAIKRAAGIQIDVLADKETVVPGEDLTASVKVYFPAFANVELKQASLGCSGCQTSKLEAPKDADQNVFRREAAKVVEYFKISVPQDAKPTQPYWLWNERKDALFDWQANDPALTFPFQQPRFVANLTLSVGGKTLIFSQPIQYRYADQTRGEIRRDIDIVPALSVSMEQKLLVVPYSEKPQTRRVTLSVTNNAPSTISSAALNFAAGQEWDYKSDPPGIFTLRSKGEKTNLGMELTIPAKTKPGIYNIYGTAQLGSSTFSTVEIKPGVFNVYGTPPAEPSTFSQEMHTIAYPHIQTHRFYTRAVTKVTVLDLKTVPAKIGYITGSGDDVPDAIRQMGYDLTMLDEKELASGDLSRFNTIVVGIRASETRADFVAHNQRLMEYVKTGGVLLVQYQRPEYAQKKLVPFPTQMGSRVVDENAKVTILDPANPVFNFPNKITAADFDGWVQERDLYNFDNFDAAYKPLLESHDAGEPENKGGLVVAELGQGKYVYCSYAFFRQLPAGVPGAYRLFANLLSLSAKK